MQTWAWQISRGVAAHLNRRQKGPDPLVYEFKKHDMVVTFTRRDDTRHIVQLALGSETRTFELEEFTDFWPTMIEEGRKATSAYLESLRMSHRRIDKEV
jgi:hypothetical protein